MAMADFAGLMEEFGRNAEKMVVPDLAKRKAMTKAGAEVLKTKLHDETRARHYQAGRKIGNEDLDVLDAAADLLYDVLKETKVSEYKAVLTIVGRELAR